MDILEDIKRNKWRYCLIALFIVAEIVMFFFLPLIHVRWVDELKRSTERHFSLFYILTHDSSQFTADFYMRASSSPFAVLAIYAVLITGILLGFGKSYRKINMAIAIACVVLFYLIVPSFRVIAVYPNSGDIEGFFSSGIIWDIVNFVFHVGLVSAIVIYNLRLKNTENSEEDLEALNDEQKN